MTSSLQDEVIKEAPPKSVFREKLASSSAIKTGLSWKISVGIILLVFSMCSVFILWFYQFEKKVRDTEFRKTCLATMECLRFSLQTNLQEATPLQIQKQLQTEGFFAKIAYVRYSNKEEKRLLYSKYSETRMLEKAEARIQQNNNYLVSKAKKENPNIFYIALSDKRYSILSKIIRPETATLEIGFVELTDKTGIVAIGKLWAGMCLIFIVIGLAIGWVFSNTIINPIQQLAKAMNLVVNEEANFDEQGMPRGRWFQRLSEMHLQIRTHDEIEQLADEFYAMLRKLENAYIQLENMVRDKNRIVMDKSQLAENLEVMNRRNELIIKDRTREVVERNLKLYEITEELQIQKEELINMNARLEKISQMKSEFLANMSHELRTPLNSIIGFTEVMKERMFGEINEKQEKYLSNILASSKHLLDLINNILDISKVEAGKMVLCIEPYSFNRVIEEVQNIIRTLAYKKNIEIISQLGQDSVVHGDVSKVKQILYNLLSNAIKFTDEKGKIYIETREVARDYKFAGGPGAEAFINETPGMLLSIRDTGIGIKREDQARVFMEFEQVDRGSQKKYEGTGLGLALTRRLVQLHGGKIWLESMPEKGTEIFVVLPVRSQPVSETQKEEGKN